MTKKIIVLLSLMGALIFIGSLLIFNRYFSARPIDIQQAIKQYVDEGKTVGVVVGYLDNGNEHYYAYGTTSIDNHAAVDQQTIFEIGSITKVFTVAALMELAKQGKASLDDEIPKYLPGINVPQKNGKQITLRHLAHHTSGLPRLPDNLNLQKIDNPYRDYTVDELYEFLNSYALTREPGVEVEYSNIGLGLLGHILTLIEHKPFDQLIQDLVCAPLGMRNTSQYVMSPMQGNVALGHAMNQKVSNWDFDVLEGAGALKSNARDMMVFLKANMAKINTLLQEANNQFDESLFLGWQVARHNDSNIIWHNGGTGGFRSFMGFNVSNQKGVVILSNSSDPFVDELGFALLQV